MILYIVNHDDNGENFDLLVRTKSPDHAIRLWWDYLSEAVDSTPDRVFLVPQDSDGVLRWHDDVKQVA